MKMKEKLVYCYKTFLPKIEAIRLNHREINYKNKVNNMLTVSLRAIENNEDS
jgi:hypothetical protein